jgi:methylamine dehydrogenase heavy chain
MSKTRLNKPLATVAMAMMMSLTAVAIAVHAESSASPPPPLAPEVSDVATLSSPGPHRFMTLHWEHGAVIYDGDSGKIQGQVPMAHDSGMRASQNDSKFYVAETMWTRGNRGVRQDLLSIYDGKTLNLLKEIELPGRLIVDSKLQDLELNAAGTRAYVYNMSPASSVVWVDLTKQMIGGSVETPGCALIFPWGESGFSSLCSDGSMATVSISGETPPTITHTKPFFDAANDPIFDNSIADRATGRAVFLSYTGLIYSASLGVTPTIEKPWSLQVAAGQKAPGTGIEELAWRPGGVQPIAWHKDSDRLFILMHPGNYWSHRDGGTEIWVLNRSTHALITRFPVLLKPESTAADPRSTTVRGIAVSQREHPQIYLMNSSGGVTIMDADTGAVLRKIDDAEGNAALVPDA